MSSGKVIRMAGLVSVNAFTVGLVIAVVASVNLQISSGHFPIGSGIGGIGSTSTSTGLGGIGGLGGIDHTTLSFSAASPAAAAAFCGPCDHKEACFGSIGSVAQKPSANPKDLVQAALQSTITHVTAALDFSGSVAANTSGSQKMFMEDCKDLLGFAVDELHTCFSTVGVTDLRSLHDKQAELLNWLSAVISYQHTCIDGIFDSHLKQKIMSNGLTAANQLTSNALAIVSTMSAIFDAFKIPFNVATGGGTARALTGSGRGSFGFNFGGAGGENLGASGTWTAGIGADGGASKGVSGGGGASTDASGGGGASGGGSGSVDANSGAGASGGGDADAVADGTLDTSVSASGGGSTNSDGGGSANGNGNADASGGGSANASGAGSGRVDANGSASGDGNTSGSTNGSADANGNTSNSADVNGSTSGSGSGSGHGSSSGSGSADANGSANGGGSVDANGSTSGDGSTSSNGSADANGNVSGSVDANGSASGGGSASGSGSADANGSASGGGSASGDGSANGSGTVDVYGSASGSGSTDANGNASGDGSASGNDGANTSANGGVDVNGGVNASGGTGASGGGNASSDTSASGDGKVNSNSSVSGGGSADGDSSASGGGGNSVDVDVSASGGSDTSTSGDTSASGSGSSGGGTDSGTSANGGSSASGGADTNGSASGSGDTSTTSGGGSNASGGGSASGDASGDGDASGGVGGAGNGGGGFSWGGGWSTNFGGDGSSGSSGSGGAGGGSGGGGGGGGGSGGKEGGFGFGFSKSFNGEINNFNDLNGEISKSFTVGSGSRRLKEVYENNGEYPSWLSAADRRLLRSKNGNQNPSPNKIVAKDGSGDFKTIGEALASYPKKHEGRYVIYVKAGIYDEYLTVTKDQVNVFIYGDGPRKTIITGRKNFHEGVSTFRTATFSAIGNGFVAKSIGFQNTAGPEGHQAVALRVQSDMSAFYNCRIDGYQDTLYVQTHRQFYRNCVISGTVDFIFGDAAAVIQNSLVIVRKPGKNQKNAVTAQGRVDKHETTGIVIQNCRIVPEQKLFAERLTVPTYLGRPWKQYSRTVIMETTIGDLIQPAGWMEWEGNFALDTLYYAEYANRGVGAATNQRVKWKGYKVITDRNEALQFTPAPFLQGDLWLANTGAPFFLGFKH